MTVDAKAQEVLKKFESAYDSKNALGLYSDWVEFDDYYFSRVNLPQTKDDPGSSTNVIFPVIESQIADLVGQPTDIIVKGEEPSDHVFASHVHHILRWIWEKNDMVFKLDRHEHHRLKFGIGFWKVWYDPNALRGRGLPVIEPINPVNALPDPKVDSREHLQEGDFFIHATYKPINWIKRHPVFREKAQELRPAEYFSSRDLLVFESEDSTGVNDIARDKALFIECWQTDLDEEGEPYKRLIVVANNIVLYDSTEHRKIKGSSSFYRHGEYPFVVTPCYTREGVLWGVGDVELLIPTQDLINDLDDQIRRNARLMGNIQKVIGIASGINPKKWTNKAGLNICARDPNAWQMVRPPEMPGYILERRNQALSYESQVISGRGDAVEGRQPGSLRAAAAIIALQEAGIRRVNHKRLLLQAGLKKVLDIVVDYVKEYFTEERAFRIIGSKNDDYIWFRGSSLKNITRLVPRAVGEGGEEYTLKPLLDEEGREMKKEAVFDIQVNIGAGMPTTKSFIYQAVNELHANGLVTTEEARRVLKEVMNWPIIDPQNPVGSFAGRNVPPEVTQMMNMSSGGGMPSEGEIPPEIMQQLMRTLNTSGGMVPGGMVGG